MNNPMLSKMEDISGRALAGETASYAGVAVKSMGLVALVAASAIATWSIISAPRKAAISP